MKKLVALSMLLMLSGFANAGGRSASMQVTFVINEACAIQTAGKNASVKCNIDAPYQVQAAPQSAPAAAAPSAVQADAGVTTIVF